MCIHLNMPRGVYKRTQWHRKRIKASRRTIQIEPGQKIGKRTIVKEIAQGKHYRRRFKFKCRCGRTGIVHLAHLNDGYGCGCGRKSGIWAAAEARRKPKFTASFNQLIAGYKRSAKKRKLVWELSEIQFRKLTKMPCRYCGNPPSAKATHGGRHNGDYVYTGIDRQNSKQGYTFNNSVPCCKTCNYAKRDLSEKEFVEWIARVYVHFMNDLNTHIDTSHKFTAEPDAMPVVDRSQHVNLGLEMAQRAALQQQTPQPPPTPMTPIVAVAN